MATVYITEHERQGFVGKKPVPVLPPPVVEQAALTSTGASQVSAVVGGTTHLVRIAVKGVAGIHIAIGVVPVAVQNGYYIPPDVPEVLEIDPGERVAIIDTA